MALAVVLILFHSNDPHYAPKAGSLGHYDMYVPPKCLVRMLVAGNGTIEGTLDVRMFLRLEQQAEACGGYLKQHKTKEDLNLWPRLP